MLRYGRRMRNAAFSVVYWLLSITYGLLAALCVLLPGRAATAFFIRRYVRRMVQAMRIFAGIAIRVQGREHLPQGAFIVASKHQSWGDGFATYDQFDDLAFVTGDHLEKMPLLGPVLRKIGAIVVDSCGGHQARAALKQRAADAHRDGRKILIFPEGALAPVGKKYRYRSGVWHMARDFGLPVVPLATNLGLFWPPQGKMRPGTMTLAFLPPIVASEDKGAFLSMLETAIEAKTAELVAEAAGSAAVPAILIPRPDEGGLAHAAPDFKPNSAAYSCRGIRRLHTVRDRPTTACGAGTLGPKRRARTSRRVAPRGASSMVNPILALLFYLLDIYSWIVIIAVITQYLIMFRVINTANQLVRTIVSFLFSITEPVFRFVRRFVPSIGGVDLSPVIVLIALWFVRYVIQWAVWNGYFM